MVRLTNTVLFLTVTVALFLYNLSFALYPFVFELAKEHFHLAVLISMNLRPLRAFPILLSVRVNKTYQTSTKVTEIKPHNE